MAVTYDNDAEATADAQSTVTVASFTVGNNSNRYLIVGIGIYPDTVSVSSVTYGGSGTGWSQITTRNQSSGQERVSIWGKVAPAVGTADLVVTLSGSITGGVHVLSVYDVDQATPLGTPAGNDGFDNNSVTTTVTGATGDLFYDCVEYYANVSPAISADSPQTSRANQSVGNFRHGASTKAGAASATMSWTATGSTEPQWAQAAVALKAAAGGGQVVVSRPGVPLILSGGF